MTKRWKSILSNAIAHSMCWNTMLRNCVSKLHSRYDHQKDFNLYFHWISFLSSSFSPLYPLITNVFVAAQPRFEYRYFCRSHECSSFAVRFQSLEHVVWKKVFRFGGFLICCLFAVTIHYFFHLFLFEVRSVLRKAFWEVHVPRSFWLWCLLLSRHPFWVTFLFYIFCVCYIWKSLRSR